ncbi:MULTISPECIES: glycosyltransferase [unclassified Synechocystis]|nr:MULTISPECIES: glycosyltransferase [unclassified Synechocystis]UOO13139.1 glycosyltransferase [Synechocystis sp. PCC 6803]
MKYPRILIINPVPFNHINASGITTSNLFRGWPLDKIAQIYSHENDKYIDHKICQNYLHIVSKSLIPEKLTLEELNKPLQRISDLLSGNSLTLGGWLANPSPILKWIKNFNPEIIYARPLDTPYFYWRLPYQISRNQNIPYAIHIMDDWPARYGQRSGIIDNFIRKPALQKQLKRLIENSSLNIGISEQMCKAFEERYKRPFVTFHNCIEIDNFINQGKTDKPSDNLQVVYTGSVTEDKELGSLIDIKDVILSLNTKGYQITLTIYAPSIYQEIIDQKLAIPNVIKYGGFFPPELKPNILANADLLLLPLNFDVKSIIYTQYSFQSKLPEYMASGTPILLYGPNNNPNIEYAKKNDFGFIVTENNQKELTNFFLRIIKDQKLREHQGKMGQRLAFADFNAEVIRERFHKSLCQIARNKLG